MWGLALVSAARCLRVRMPSASLSFFFFALREKISTSSAAIQSWVENANLAAGGLSLLANISVWKGIAIDVISWSIVPVMICWIPLVPLVNALY